MFRPSVSPCCFELFFSTMCVCVCVCVAGDPPCRRRGHVAVVVAGHLYIHGGVGSSNEQLCDLWALDLATWHWSLVLPQARAEMCTRSGRGKGADRKIKRMH